MNPNYPIYVVSKGRWTNAPTLKALEYMKVPYQVIVKKEEYDNYASVISSNKILIEPQSYIENYDTFWHDTDPRTGPGAARNFAWDDSIEHGYDFHWVLDDNIDAFHRVNRGYKAEVASGTIFRCMEDFVFRYSNVAIAGPNYYKFVRLDSLQMKPFQLNTRIYSCLFIRNDIPFRWRGRYNEDTDLSLRVLKAGWVTIQFNAFLQGKITTQRVRGGNTEQFYNKEGTYPKSKMLEEMHPDVAKVVWRFSRWHHLVNYKPFKHNKLKLKEGVIIPEGVNNYGMELIKYNSTEE